MKRLIAFCVVVMFFAQALFAQKEDSIGVLTKKGYELIINDLDSLSLQNESSQTLRALKDGAIIVRLKTSSKSIDAYRKAGQNELADKIEANRKTQNLKLMDAFTTNFYFCKVYFIFSNDTKAFLEGNHNIFLNDTLGYKSVNNIGNNFILCEYGSAESYSNFSDYNHPVAGPVSGVNLDKLNDKKMEDLSNRTSTAPATNSGLILLDKELKQLQRPFPYVVGVYLDNFDASVRQLNREMERAYDRQVVRKDMKAELKAEKKRLKAEHKKQPRYNPFK